MDKQKEPTVLEGRIKNVPGRLVFDTDGFCRGFININDTRSGGIMSGPDGIVAGVLLPDGTIQNPNGTKSQHTDPVQYLLETVEPIRDSKYHISSVIGNKYQVSGKGEKRIYH